MINYGKQSINNNDIKSVVKTLKSNFLTQGPLVEKFELELKKTLKSKYSTVVNNGSSALITVGKILNWKKGDLIAVPPITFLSSVNAIEHCGAKPLFIEEERFANSSNNFSNVYADSQPAIVNDGFAPGQIPITVQIKVSFELISE